MYFSRSVLVLGCALFLAGCENTSGAFHPRPAMSVEGFSFMPPQGEGWTVSDTRVRDGRAVTFTRADGPVLQVRTWRTSQRYRGQDGLRVEASGWRAGLAFDSAPAGLAGADCLSYRSYWTDETGGTPLDHERHGIMCWNPNDPNRLFDLSLTEGAPTGELSREAGAQAKPYLSSLRWGAARTDGGGSAPASFTPGRRS
jgi:hypothetical protein